MHILLIISYPLNKAFELSLASSTQITKYFILKG